tara:strand:- start:338 stop:616 length:279 start_codon:yes stop_codon:yes gene_type:complete
MDMSLAEKVKAVIQHTGHGIPTILGEVFNIKSIVHHASQNPDDPEEGTSYTVEYFKAITGIPAEKPLSDREAELLHKKADEILGLNAKAEPA